MSLWPLVRYATAIVAGLLWTAAFPNWNVAGLAWVVPGLLLAVASGGSGAVSLRLGYVAGLAHALTSYHWLLFIPFPAGAVVGWLALSAYLALYPATWVWLCRQLASAPLSSETPAGPAPFAAVFAMPWWRRALWTLVCAALWVALELVRSRFLTGFPWSLLGVSQYEVLPLIQVASITGVYGVSFLIVWTSVALAVALARVFRQPRPLWDWMAELRLPLVGVLVVAVFGVNRIARPASSRGELRVALIQPGIPQTLIWDHREDSNRFHQVLELSRLALANGADLLVWPEAAMPGLSEENFRSLADLVTARKAWMVFGADDAETPAAGSETDGASYNAAFLLSPDAKVAGVYRKQRLVIFGEYVPFARWLPFLRKLIPVPADFASGQGAVQFALTEPRAQLSVLICFEDVFPHLARQHVEDGTDFLLNITNDGWFGNSAAQWQHAANAVFRAVENGRPLIRCTNNGVTCWIDPQGRLRRVLGSASKDVYAAGFMMAEIPLPGEDESRSGTIYRRHGDWFAWSCLVISAAMLAARLKVFRKGRRAS